MPPIDDLEQPAGPCPILELTRGHGRAGCAIAVDCARVMARRAIAIHFPVLKLTHGSLLPASWTDHTRASVVREA
eukprot:37797-Eustigmatos_ZCMA.PRE.1